MNYQLKVPACSHSSPHTDWLELPSLDALSPVGHSQPLFVSEHQGFRTVKLPYSAPTTRRWLPMHQQLSFIHAETCTCVTPCLHPELQPDCIHGELPSPFGVHMCASGSTICTCSFLNCIAHSLARGLIWSSIVPNQFLVVLVCSETRQVSSCIIGIYAAAWHTQHPRHSHAGPNSKFPNSL